MIYFTKDALRIIKQKFFYLELADGSKAIVYKQDKSKAQEALKKEKYKLKFSFYSMLDKNNVQDDVYLLGVGNKQNLMDKILKILNRESLNIIYIEVNSKWNILFLSDNNTKKDIYKNPNPELYSWPCIVANEEFSIKLKQKLKPERELSNIINELTKLEK
ncbi:MAG: hypothetical protein Q4B93_03700 [Clostridia bacterium]|nr:hypothetical protein [Clostridia bacterium]